MSDVLRSPHASTVNRLSALTCLDEPARRALFDLACSGAAPLSRDDAAAALGIPRSTASFHLDRLVAEGLLTSEFRQLGSRRGPGSGRPSKLYRPAVGEISFSIPERDYELAADLLAAAVSESADTGEPAHAVLLRLADRAGERLGADAGSVQAVLEENGFKPQQDGLGGFILGNCPFHRLARDHTELVCGLNGSLLTGAVRGCGESGYRAVPDADGPSCCVRIAGAAPEQSQRPNNCKVPTAAASAQAVTPDP